MGEFFNPEKGIWAWLSTLVDVVGLSVLWIALCLPVVTIGPATAALYYAVVRYVRRRESGAFGGYLRSFRANFAVGLRATLTVIPGVRGWSNCLTTSPPAITWPYFSRLLTAVFFRSGMVVKRKSRSPEGDSTAKSWIESDCIRFLSAPGLAPFLLYLLVFIFTGSYAGAPSESEKRVGRVDDIQVGRRGYAGYVATVGILPYRPPDIVWIHLKGRV